MTQGRPSIASSWEMFQPSIFLSGRLDHLLFPITVYKFTYLHISFVNNCTYYSCIRQAQI